MVLFMVNVYKKNISISSNATIFFLISTIRHVAGANISNSRPGPLPGQAALPHHRTEGNQTQSDPEIDNIMFVQVRKLEWRCRGCFSISDTKESRVAVLENELPLSLIFPDRYNQIPSKYHPSVKKHHPNTKKNHPNTTKYNPNNTTHL